MKKKVFKAFGVLAIIAILALNVSVVLDSSSSILKWDLIGKILASSGGSGSGSGSGTESSTKYENSKSCTFTDSTTGLSGPGCEDPCDGSSGNTCSEAQPCASSGGAAC